MLQPVFNTQENTNQHETPIKRNKNHQTEIKTAESQQYTQTLQDIDPQQLCQQFAAVVQVTEDYSIIDSAEQLERQLNYEVKTSVMKLNFDPKLSSLKKKPQETHHFKENNASQTINLFPGSSKICEKVVEEVTQYDCITPVGREIKLRPELNMAPIKDRNTNRHRN